MTAAICGRERGRVIARFGKDGPGNDQVRAWTLGGAASPSTLSSAVAQRTRRGAAHLPRRVEAHDRRPENAVAALPTWDMHDWLVSWPALALACGLPQRANGVPRIPSPSQLCKRGPAAGAPPFETLFVLTMWRAVRCRLIGARESLHR